MQNYLKLLTSSLYQPPSQSILYIRVMAIKLTPGNLYFIRDIDYLSKEIGHYVKIGIVTNNRTTEQRMKDHQTGNPRGIFDVHEVVNVPFVERLETQLHYEYNERWITGEWFLLNEKEAKAVYKRAIALKDEQISREKIIRKVLEKLSEIISTGLKKKATKIGLGLETHYLNVKKELNELDARIELSKFAFYKLLGANGSIDGVLKIRYSGPSYTFDEKAFKAAHPKIHAKFLVSKPDKLDKRFTMDNISTVSLSKVNPTLETQKKAITAMTYTASQLNSKKARTKAIEKLHLEHLRLLREHKIREFELEMVQYELQALVGNTEGIDGICTWSRKMKSVPDALDTAAVKNAYPNLYAKFCTTLKKEVFSMDVEKYRAYKPK